MPDEKQPDTGRGRENKEGGWEVGWGRKKRKRKEQNGGRSESRTDQPWLSLDWLHWFCSVSQTAHFQLSAFKFGSVCVCARAPSREVNSRLSWILVATSHFLVSGVKIDGEVLKCDTGRYYPACHSHLSGLLCVCPASTPRARGEASVAPCHMVKCGWRSV